MDKFVQRKPSWKTKTYEAAVAEAAQKTQRLHHATPVRRPLQEHPASNVTPKHLNQPQNTEDTMRASEKMPDDPVARPIVSQPMTPRSISQGPSVETKNNVTTPTSRPAGLWARLQNDLNSPSALLRVRAIRALKSPTRSAYNVFDVPHTEQSIISADERNPKPPPSLQEVMSSVVAYVEVRSGNDNRSAGVKSVIADMGAQINDRLLRNTTHVIFKDGLLSTYKKAINWKIPVVSVLWLEACKSQRRVCEPEKFPISKLHKYEYSELYGKIKRVRCMQPGSELAIRPSRRLGSGSKRTALGTPTTTAKNDISRFFEALNHNKQIAGEDAVESPATKLLNRIANGSYTPVSQRPSPLQTGDRLQVQEKPHDSGEKLQAQRILNFNEKPGSDEQQPAKPQHRRSTAEASPVATPVRTSRLRSSAHISMTSNADASQPPQPEQRVTRRRSSAYIPLARNQDDVPPPLEPRTTHGCSSAPNPMTSITEAASETEPRMTRRRSSAHILTTINVDDPPPAEAEPRLKRHRSSAHIPMASNTDAVAPPQPDLRMTRRRSSLLQAAKEPMELTPQNVLAAIAEELSAIHEDKNSIAEEPAGDATESNCQTSLITKMDERMADAKILNKTDFVQHSLEISVGNPSPSRVLYQADKRGTLYTSERMDISKEFQDVNLTARKSMSNVTMQTSTLLDEHSTPPMFSSTRLPNSRSSTTVNRRRTQFDLDMEVINRNIFSLNASHRLSLLLADQDELGEWGKSVVTAEKSRAEENPSNEPKRRRLFTPNEVVVTPSSKTNKKQRLSFSGNNASTQSGKKRRRSLAVPACPSSESSCLSAHVERESTDKFLTPDGSLNNANDINTSSGMNVAGVEKSATSKRRSRVIRTLVHTNMHQGQVQVIQKYICSNLHL
ncbi:uncharacterized protein LOC108159012 isoform X2 [Drosophila miranda]|uniref:uncharacterized protein LOC108159012 isoform X2 n=1 Tax=Drosophila miranda TaxID=7229 RepID=UPI0007E82CFB|nr:uncharacterized protein LOC108159012 isoform X2 [Drosophila miranda]